MRANETTATSDKYLQIAQTGNSAHDRKETN
jgi:hypothetical protein